jgi:glycosyltransferase involved in cell wall biosynthesis
MSPERIFVAPNAVYRASDMHPSVDTPLTAIDSFVFVGRLVREKKPDALLQAFRGVQAFMPEGVRLVFVGDGPMRQALELDAAELGSAVEFRGHVGSHAALKGIYSRAIASVSPGYAGLSLTQSLGFGVPMIISRNEPHAPEIVAAEEGWNSIYFDADVPGDLERALQRMVADRDQWASRRVAIADRCRSLFSAESMADGFLRAAGWPGA